MQKSSIDGVAVLDGMPPNEPLFGDFDTPTGQILIAVCRAAYVGILCIISCQIRFQEMNTMKQSFGRNICHKDKITFTLRCKTQLTRNFTIWMCFSHVTWTVTTRSTDVINIIALEIKSFTANRFYRLRFRRKTGLR